MNLLPELLRSVSDQNIDVFCQFLLVAKDLPEPLIAQLMSSPILKISTHEPRAVVEERVTCERFVQHDQHFNTPTPNSLNSPNDVSSGSFRSRKREQRLQLRRIRHFGKELAGTTVFLPLWLL